MATKNQLWDLAGRDGLSVARSLFGEEVNHLAPFQSLETTLQDKPCSVLRLCDRNFRLGYSGPLNQIVEPLGASVWVKQLAWMQAIALPDSLFPRLRDCVTVRPPHRLDLPHNCAVPAQVDGVAVLAWRHIVAGQPTLEVHFARADADKILTVALALDGS
ncbi:MAG: hypothetical protein WBA10_02585 [Elainellaceae cyanobacterium]